MIEKLKDMKQKSNMTNQQIAEKSGVPESTVARIFSGKTSNPTIATILSMVRAMGGSVDDLFDDTARMDFLKEPIAESLASIEKKPDSSQDASDLKLVMDKFYIEIIAMYQRVLHEKDRWLKVEFWCLAVMVLFIMTLLIIDILNPTVGFVRY